ncbi:MAG: porin, partial [Candidatus Dadabacteria bacterium]|nr:porin [Candidatus Dadabacteria bacterium]
MRFLAVLAVSFMMLLPFMSFPAQAGGELSIKEQIKELKQQIESLEEQNQQMNMKMYEATDTKAWYNKIKVKTKKGTGLTFQTADENYKLRMRLRGQFLANYIDPDTNMDDDEGFGFRVRRLRVTWDGNAFAPWMKYKFQYDFSREGELKDMKLSFAKNKAFVPTVGQYKVPFNREVLNSSSALQLVGRSIITDYFEYDRDIGVGVYGLMGDGMIRYDLGLFQGEGTNEKNDKKDTGLLWSGRIQASIMGDSAKKVRENMAKKPTLTVGAAVAGIELEKGSDANIGIPSEERGLENGT